MKREFLKSLGIEDKEVIDKIMDENSSDIGRAKGDTDALNRRITDLEGQIQSKDGEIATLQKKVGDTDALNQKVSQLETDKTNLTNELNTKVAEIQKDHAIEGKIRDAKGKNIKAIKALLTMDTIKFENGELSGVDEQLTALASAEDSSMLFGETQPPAPSGTNPYTPPAGGGMPSANSLADAIANAIGNAGK